MPLGGDVEDRLAGQRAQAALGDRRERVDQGSDDGGVMNMTWTSPAISPVMAGAAPR